MADVAPALYAALVGASTVTSELDNSSGSYPIYTRRPVPADSVKPLVVVSPDILYADEDGLGDKRPLITRDISVYGANATAAEYRAVERIAYAVRDLFHRRPDAITVSGWGVSRIEAQGPIPAPTDDDQTVGRLVTLAIRLYQ